MDIVATRQSTLSLQARGVRAILGAGLSFAMALVCSLGPDGFPSTACWFREFTGVSCFTCGMTRSLHASANGNLLAAFHYHLLGPFLLCGILIASMIWILEAIAGHRLVTRCHAVLKERALAGAVIIGISYGVARALWEMIV